VVLALWPLVVAIGVKSTVAVKSEAVDVLGDVELNEQAGEFLSAAARML
jgi:hypothetical protein